MGRIVIETDPETGMDRVELTLDTGQVLTFEGNGNSELRWYDPETEMVDVSTPGDDEGSIPGRTTPAHWSFHVNIEDIPKVTSTEPSEE